ncbi:MAG: hypothetical protein HYX39_02845 [Bacteroidetes bacterium]|nr:hypothetical protein [Bacteroidota bacterium]
MKKASFFYILLVTIVTLTNCQKLIQTSWVYYDETACADPWGDSNNDESSKKNNVKNYLKDKDIKVFEVQILNDGTLELCYSCGCKTGHRIKCKIKSKDKANAIALNFYE